MDSNELNNLPLLNEALADLEKELEALKLSAAHIEKSKSAAETAIQAAEKFQKSASALSKPIHEVIERINNVDFPSRFDKLDATVSAMQAGLQNIQGRIDGLERTVKDEISDLEKMVVKSALRNERKISDKLGEFESTVTAKFHEQKGILEANAQAAHNQGNKLSYFALTNLVLLLGLIGFTLYAGGAAGLL